MRSLSFYAPFLLIPFAVQLAVLFATGRRFRPLRFALPILVGAAAIVAILFSGFAIMSSFDIPFLEDIGVLLGPLFILTAIILCLVLGLLALMGWGLAWLVYLLIRSMMKALSFSMLLIF